MLSRSARVLLVVGLWNALSAGASPSSWAQSANDSAATNGQGTAWSVTIGAGAAVRPTFEGSDRYVVSPVPLIRVVFKDMISLDASGLNAYARFDGLQIGGGLTFNPGRTQKAGVFNQGDSRLAGLGDIPAAVGVRAFVNYKLGPVLLSSTLTKFLMKGNNGLLIDAGIGLPWRLTDNFMLTGRASVTWADSNYMRQYFGVNSAQSTNSRFARYDTKAGLKDVGISVAAQYQISQRWAFSTNAGVKFLTGYAARSPISFSDTNFNFISTLGYRF